MAVVWKLNDRGLHIVINNAGNLGNHFTGSTYKSNFTDFTDFNIMLQFFDIDTHFIQT